MDSDENDDDFFISASAATDEGYQQDSVYIESKSPAKKRLHSSDICGSSVELQASAGSFIECQDLSPKSSNESDVQVIDSFQPTVETTSPLGRRRTRRRGYKEEGNSSDSSSGRSRSPRSSQSPPPRAKRQKSSSVAASLTEPDENEEFFNEIARETTSRVPKSNQNSKDQSRRIYNVRFQSKLDGSINKTVQVKVMGKYELSAILSPVLEKLCEKFKIPDIMRDIYKPDNVSLYWNNAKLLKFMTCNSLGVPQVSEADVSDIDILMVAENFEKEFEEGIRLRLLEEEAAAAAEKKILKDGQTIDPTNDYDQSNNDVALFEQELKNAREVTATNNVIEYINLDSDEEKDVIKVALVGQDNKKLYVNVRPSTRISKLAEYFRLHRQLPKTASIKLLFDHEELDLRATVGEQDIEEEDMIEALVS